MPNMTFVDVHGGRIVSVETPHGFVHVCDQQVFAHVSDAVRYLRAKLPSNPVQAALDADATLQAQAEDGERIKVYQLAAAASKPTLMDEPFPLHEE